VDGGLPLGLASGSTYSESRFRIEPDQQLTILTDGVVEARDSSGQLFGFDRTRAISGFQASKIAEIAQAFGQEDDITVLTLTFAPVGVAHA
jgi:serine phosphatase RsbU (regulator of sigma subunit)